MTPLRSSPPRARHAVPMVTRAALAKVLGVSIRMVSQLEAEGVIVPTRRGRAGRASEYDLVRVVPQYLSYVTAMVPESPRDRYWQARAAREQLDLARVTGTLISREQVILEGRAYTRAWCAQLDRVPHALRQAGADSAIVDVARRLVREIRTDIANWKTLVDLDQAAEKGDA